MDGTEDNEESGTTSAERAPTLTYSRTTCSGQGESGSQLPISTSSSSTTLGNILKLMTLIACNFIFAKAVARSFDLKFP